MSFGLFMILWKFVMHRKRKAVYTFKTMRNVTSRTIKWVEFSSQNQMRIQVLIKVSVSPDLQECCSACLLRVTNRELQSAGRHSVRSLSQQTYAAFQYQLASEMLRVGPLFLFETYPQTALRQVLQRNMNMKTINITNTNVMTIYTEKLDCFWYLARLKLAGRVIISLWATNRTFMGSKQKQESENQAASRWPEDTNQDNHKHKRFLSLSC